MQTAVITGASSGLGKAFAIRLAEQGYNLVLVARRQAELEALAAQLPVDVKIVTADLTNTADLERVAHILATDTSISLLINNAGTTVLSTFTESSYAKQQEQITLNLVAPVRLSHAVLQGFKQRNQGTLVNIGSAIGFHSLAATSVYSGTKAFLDKFSQGLQEEFKGTGVRIVLAAPAGVATDIYEKAGVPLSAFDPALFMTIDDCVNAILSGIEKNEVMIMPSVEDEQLFQDYEAARLKLFAATQTGKPASRY
jgi:short-subunit dehydrogenase